MNWRGAGYGLASAALFGVSAPLAKLLLPSSGALVLAAVGSYLLARSVWR